MRTRMLGRVAVGFIVLATGLASRAAVQAKAPFDDAIVTWHLAGPDDSAGANSRLVAEGDVTLGVELRGQEREASLLRGGDGKAAEFRGGFLLAGQGAGNELNPEGSALTVCIRLRDPSGEWDTSLFSKHGGHDKLVYNFFTFDLPNGPGVDLGFELGTEAGMYQAALPIAEMKPADGWHDVIARYDGKSLDLFVDGALASANAATGALRRNNPEPCVLGGESSGGKPHHPFKGFVDHAALWGRALSDAEIASLSGVKEVSRPAYYSERYRPQFHFTPEQNFTNDPNGMFYFDGEYHLFYQYNPFGNTWGHMSWGHAVSPDMVHWQHLPVALAEENGVMIFSGSAVVDANNTSGFGKDGKPPLVAIYTGHHTAGGRQTQDIAYSTDRGRNWTKFPGNPVIDIQSNDFRDPKVFWHEPAKKWVMVVCLAAEKKASFYASPDLKKWTHLSDFGPAGAPGAPNWECPDLFPLAVEGENASKWVLHINIGGGMPAGGSGGQYFVGEFDGTSFKSDNPPDKVLWTDYGKDYYAAVSWSDVPPQDGRRLWLGWMCNWQYANDTPTSPWRNGQSLPRSLALRRTPDGLRMVQQPVKELEKLRGRHERREQEPVTPDSPLRLEPGDLLEIVAEFQVDAASEFGLRVRKGQAQQTLVGYDVKAGELFVDRTQSGRVDFSPHFPGRHAGPLKPRDGRVKLHVFVDRGSVEVFGNDGETVLTELVFADPQSRGLEVYAEGGEAKLVSLDVWELKSVWASAAADR